MLLARVHNKTLVSWLIGTLSMRCFYDALVSFPSYHLIWASFECGAGVTGTAWRLVLVVSSETDLVIRPCYLILQRDFSGGFTHMCVVGSRVFPALNTPHPIDLLSTLMHLKDVRTRARLYSAEAPRTCRLPNCMQITVMNSNCTRKETTLLFWPSVTPICK